MTNKDSCWYQGDSLYKSMIESVKNHKPLNEVGHGEKLIELIELIPEKNLDFLDAGCGGALCNTITNGHSYTGADLEHVINNVSMKCFPDLEYLEMDLIEDSLESLESFNIILLNAILDIMEDPITLLERILKHSKKYVIIHRQQIVEGNRGIDGYSTDKQESYGGFTYHTYIDRYKFEEVITNSGFKIIKELDSGLGLPNNKSFLLKKDE